MEGWLNLNQLLEIFSGHIVHSNFMTNYLSFNNHFSEKHAPIPSLDFWTVDLTEVFKETYKCLQANINSYFTF